MIKYEVWERGLDYIFGAPKSVLNKDVCTYLVLALS